MGLNLLLRPRKAIQSNKLKGIGLLCIRLKQHHLLPFLFFPSIPLICIPAVDRSIAINTTIDSQSMLQLNAIHQTS